MTRFERKILFAILLVALGPLVGSLLIGRAILQEVYQLGVNKEFGEQLTQGVDARKAHLLALRRESERTIDAIVHRLNAVVDDEASVQVEADRFVQQYSNVTNIVVTHDGREIASASDPTPEKEPLRKSVRERELSEKMSALITVTVPMAPFEKLQRAGEAAEVYSRLEERSASVARVYAWAYAAMLFFVIALALVTGVILSRRVTQRVAALAKATRLVGKGDLSVTVPTGATDEVTELTEAFNDMVRDLRESRERIEYLQRIGAWQDFARRLAHEIKNPLTPIQLAAQEIQQTYRGPDQGFKDKLDRARLIIEEEVATLRRLVSEFSSFAKLPQADLVPAELSEFIAQIEDSVPAILDDVGRTEGHAAKISVEIEHATDRMPVRMDPMMLKRCIDNLLRNAIQAVHADSDNPAPKVWLRAFAEGPMAVIEVLDNGPGIDRTDWQRVFDPYYTTKSEGTGLGLPIVKKVVLEHRGEIRLDTSPQGGARFRIEVPIRRTGL